MVAVAVLVAVIFESVRVLVVLPERLLVVLREVELEWQVQE